MGAGSGQLGVFGSKSMIIHITTDFSFAFLLPVKYPSRQLTQESCKAGLRSKSCYHGCKSYIEYPKCR